MESADGPVDGHETAAPDLARRDSLAERLVEATVGALEMFSIRIGRELGLYRVLADAAATGLTPDEVAAAAGIAVRYAREWLEQQAVAGLIDHADQRFILPAAHREVLVDPESPAHVAPFADMIAGVAGVLDRLPAAYRSGGGVAYSDYGAAFRSGQGGINRPIFAHELAGWFGAVPELTAAFAADDPVRIADVGCGEGWSTIALARSFPQARVDGYDFDRASVEAARRHASEQGLSAEQVTFHDRDGAGLDSGYHFILIFEALHDFARPVQVLSRMRAALVDGGCLLVADERVAAEFAAPGDLVERLMYGWSVNHCLPATLAETPSAGLGTALRPRQVADLAREAGFTACDELPIANDFFRFYRMS